MANPNRPSGFTPVGYINGSPWNGKARLYAVAAAYSGAALYIGDPVISAGGATASGVPTIALAAITNGVRGVIVGMGVAEGLMANPKNLDSTYRPAATQSTDWYVMVADDPNIIFEVQEHSNGTALAATEIGMNTDSWLGTGNGYVSGWQLGSASDQTPVVTATLQCKLLGLARKPNNTWGAYAKHLIQFNVHELSHGTGSLGIS